MDKAEGIVEVICGSMFSGKTEEMIRRLQTCKNCPAESAGIQTHH